MQKNNRQHHKSKELQMANCEWQPVAPDPTGMNAMAGLLGKSDLFRDATGLQGTQDMVNNAMKGSQELVENANKNAGDMANLAMQYNLQHEAIKAGLMTKQQAAQNLQKASEKLNRIQGEADAHDYTARMKAIQDNADLSPEAKQAAIAALTKKYIKHGAGAGAVENPLYGILDDDPDFIKNYLNSGGKITTNPDGTVTMEGGNSTPTALNEDLGKGGVKLECSDYANEADVLECLISSQHPGLRQYFILDDEGYIIKSKAQEGKLMLNTDITPTYSIDDRVIFEDLYTLVMASIPYKIAIDGKAAWMFPDKAYAPRDINEDPPVLVEYGKYTNRNGSAGLGDIKAKLYTNLQDPEYLAMLGQRPNLLYATKGDFETIGGNPGQTYPHFNKGQLVAIFTLVASDLSPLGQAQVVVHEMIHAFLCLAGKDSQHRYSKATEKITIDNKDCFFYNQTQPQIDSNFELRGKQEIHMHRTFTLNTW